MSNVTNTTTDDLIASSYTAIIQTQGFVYERDMPGFERDADRERFNRFQAAIYEQHAHNAHWALVQATAGQWRWRRGKIHQPTPCKAKGYDLTEHAVRGHTEEERLAEIETLVGTGIERRRQVNGATDLWERTLLRYNASITARGRSAEAGAEERMPLAAPAAAALADGPSVDDARSTYYAVCTIFEQLATLADRFPRTARRQENGEWQRGGLVADVLDVVAAGFERAWERRDQWHGDAMKALREAEEADTITEMGQQQLAQLEDKAIQRAEEAMFLRSIYDGARRTYGLLTGAPWNSRQRIKGDRATALKIANTTLATVYAPPPPAQTTRVIVMGGGEEHSRALAEGLARLRCKHEELTIYSGDREVGIEDQAARFALANRCQLVRLSLNHEAHKRASPFRRLEAMLDLAQADGVIIAGIAKHGPTEELVKHAQARGIKIWDLRDLDTPALAAKAPAVRIEATGKVLASA